MPCNSFLSCRAHHILSVWPFGLRFGVCECGLLFAAFWLVAFAFQLHRLFRRVNSARTPFRIRTMVKAIFMGANKGTKAQRIWGKLNFSYSRLARHKSSLETIIHSCSYRYANRGSARIWFLIFSFMDDLLAGHLLLYWYRRRRRQGKSNNFCHFVIKM